MTKKPLDYVTKDYEGFKQMMMEQIPIIAPEWTDTSEGDFGVTLMELLCYGLDILSFYQDKAVNEAFLSTAQTRKSVINICKLLGYELKQQQPYTYPLVFKKLPEFKSQSITIHAGTMVGTDPSLGQPVPFEVDTTITIPSGALGDEKDNKGNYLYATTCTQGNTVYDELGSGSGEPSQRIKLDYEDALIDTIRVWTEENGVIKDWKRVNDFLDSTEQDNHFVAQSDENNNVILEFGDGLAGARLKKHIPVFSSYRVGGGEIGNVGKGAINSFLEEEILGIDSLTNDTAIKLGCNRESINHAKAIAPKLFGTNDRAITPKDFEIISETYNGIARAKCVESFNANNDAYVYVATQDFKPTSDDFKKELKKFLDTKKVINTNVIIRDAVYKDFDINITITTFPEYANEDVQKSLSAFLGKILDTKNFDFGQELKRAMLVKELMMREEVQDIEFKAPTGNIKAEPTEILKLKSINLEVVGGLA